MMSPRREQERRHDLLILDYGGVCTLSHAEFLDAQVGDGTQTGESAGIGERPGAGPLIRRAKELGITVVILSNEIDSSWIEGSPVLSAVDHVLACTDNGILKPDRRAYQRALLIGGATADRALFVDDDMDNVHGAQSAGLMAVLFDAADPERSWTEVERTLTGG